MLSGIERETIATALGMVELAAPTLMDEMLLERLLLTPLVDRPDLAQQSFSVECLPKVVYCSIGDAFELADVLCHEYHHQKLFLIEERYSFMAAPRVAAVAPWRRDIRSARGVFHGIYVFYMLAETLGRLLEEFGASERGIRKLLMWRLLVRHGLDSLSGADWKPTEPGLTLTNEIRHRNEARLRPMDGQFATRLDMAMNEHIRLLNSGVRSEPWFISL